MSLQIEVNGVAYENFTTSTVRIALDSISGSFDFSAVSTEGRALPFSNGDACKIIVDGSQVLNGYIEKISYSYSANEHSISISGRDKTADLIDSTTNGIKLSPPLSLVQVIQAALDDIGATDISVSEETPTDDFNKAEEKISASVAENAFEFCEKLARKRQVLLTRDGNGGINITQGSGVDSGAAVQNMIDSIDDSNNIISGSISYDLTERFSRYIVKSQLNPVALNFAGVTPAKEIVSQENKPVVDETMRAGRQLVIKAENSSSSEQAKLRAEWSANIRKARGRVYSCTVSGFTNSVGNVYAPNQLIQVSDEFCEINAKMLLNSVEFSFDITAGSIASLEFVDSNAYTLELTEPKTEKLGASAVAKFDENRLKVK